MKLGFDLDKVLIHYPPILPAWLIDAIYKEKDNGQPTYRIPGKFSQKIRRIGHIPFLRKPIKEHINFLNSLNKIREHELYLISSRFGFLKNPTEALVKKHKLDTTFKQLFFNFENKQPHIFKNEVIQKLKIDRFIDDDLSLVRFLAKENPKKLFFWLNNKQNGKITDNLIATTSIESIIKK